MGWSQPNLGRHALDDRALQSPIYSRHIGRQHLSRTTGSPTTVTNDLVAIRDSTSYGLGMEVDSRTWDLLRPSSNQKLPVPPARPSGSLDRDWSFYGHRTSSRNHLTSFLRRPLLIAKQTDHRGSHLAAPYASTSSYDLATTPPFLARRKGGPQDVFRYNPSVDDS